MKLYHVLLFIYSVSFVLGEHEGSHSIKKLLSECTEVSNDMHLHSKVSMSDEEAKAFVKQLGKIKEISSLPDKSERRAEWTRNPRLKVLKTKMNSLKEIFKLPAEERKKLLAANKGMQRTVAKLALLDPDNEKSPLEGKDIKKYLRKESNSIKSNAKTGELKVKLIFRKLIPPTQEI